MFKSNRIADESRVCINIKQRMKFYKDIKRALVCYANFICYYLTFIGLSQLTSCILRSYKGIINELAENSDLKDLECHLFRGHQVLA